MYVIIAVWENKHLLTTMRYKNFERRIQLYCRSVFAERVKANICITSSHPRWPKDQEESNFVHTNFFISFTHTQIFNSCIYLFFSYEKKKFFLACLPGVLFMSEDLRNK